MKNRRHPLVSPLRALGYGILLLAGMGAARAVTPAAVPNPRSQGGWVTDMAGVIPPDTISRLNALLASLERDTSAEMAVVTVPDTGEETPKKFATDLFNRWKIGKAGRDNGVLILLATGVRRVEVETGYGIEPILPDGRVGAILDRYAVPQFRQGKYGEGLLLATEQMAAIIRKEYPALVGSPAQPAPPKTPGAGSLAAVWVLAALGASVLALFLAARGGQRGSRLPAFLAALAAVLFAALPVFLGEPLIWGVLLGTLLVLGVTLIRLGEEGFLLRSPQTRSAGIFLLQAAYAAAGIILGLFVLGAGFTSVLLYIILAVAGWLALRRSLARLPRLCPRCGAPMRLLDENETAAVLDAGQRLELELGSVDYEVWRCDACGETVSEPHFHSGSPYQVCPRCHYATLQTTQALVVAPTLFREGRERITQHCLNCGFTRAYERRLPARPPVPIIIGGGGGWGGGWGGGGGGGGGSFGGGSSGGGGAGRGW